jgi:large subunit ribosomal protein L18
MNLNKKEARARRARKTRVRIALQRATRLVVNRSNCHIYAQIIGPTGDRVLASRPSRQTCARTSRTVATVRRGDVGKRIADRASAPARNGRSIARVIGITAACRRSRCGA